MGSYLLSAGPRSDALLTEELEASRDREEAITDGEHYALQREREGDAVRESEVQPLLARLRDAPSVVDRPPVGRPLARRCSIEAVREMLAGRYDVLEGLGAGVMTEVFLARDLRLGRHVAVKVLKPEIRHLIGAERFLQEITIVAGFNHPNIVPLFEADELGGFLYYVMRHIPGESLREKIHRAGHLPTSDAVSIAVDVASALEYSHERQVVHRDVKPRNVLLHERTALIADFGTAIVLAGGGTRLTESGILVGTPEYMSPEQADPHGEVDRRSDVYGLGCLLYEMLTGETVFSGATAQAVLAKHRFERIPSVRIRRPDLPQQLEETITKALAKAPGHRFPTAEAFAEALNRL